MNAPATRPEREFRAGAIRAAVWINQRQNMEGKFFESCRIQLERRYKDKDGSFQSTHSLDMNDLPKAILALGKAYEYLMFRDRQTPNDPIPPNGFAQMGEFGRGQI